MPWYSYMRPGSRDIAHVHLSYMSHWLFHIIYYVLYRTLYIQVCMYIFSYVPLYILQKTYVYIYTYISQCKVPSACCLRMYMYCLLLDCAFLRWAFRLPHGTSRPQRDWQEVGGQEQALDRAKHSIYWLRHDGNLVYPPKTCLDGKQLHRMASSEGAF